MSSPDKKSNLLSSKETVLVVDDEILVRLAISDYLRECGYRVFEATHADEAIIVLQAPDLRIDIVLSDVDMPGAMDGFGLSRWVRANKPDIPVILAGSPERAADKAGDLCENGPQLAKPYDPQILFDRIRRTLAEAKRIVETVIKGEDTTKEEVAEGS